jgi:hypothetical protein
MNSMIFCHEGDLFAVKALARRPAVSPQAAGDSHQAANTNGLRTAPNSSTGGFTVRFETVALTANYGQRLFIALLEQETLAMLPGSPGVGVAIDPETGAVEDLVNGGGVIGYVTTAPQDPAQRVKIVVEAQIYGKVMIPRLWVGSESVIHPAILLECGPQLAAFGGSEIMNGNAAEYEDVQMVVTPVAAGAPSMPHNATASVMMA